MRQYIGARYVPTFADPFDWDISRSYEALLMVNYFGDTYTSKKPVPPGIEITNTEYWVMTGSFNSQISEMRNELSNLEDVVEQPHYVFIGDSYTGYADADISDEIRSFINVDEDKWHSKHKGGAGFIGATLGKTFLDLLNDIADDMTDYEKIHTVEVIVTGGTNDQAQTVSDIVTAMNTFKSRANTLFPNAKITYYWIGLSMNRMRDRCVDFTKFSAEGSRIGVVNVCPYVLIQSADFRDDYIHPTDASLHEIARFIGNHITTGSTCWEKHNNFRSSIEGPSSTSGNLMYGSTYGGIVCYTDYLTLNYSSPITLSNDAQTGGIPLIKFREYNNSEYNVPNMMPVRGSAFLSINNGNWEAHDVFTAYNENGQLCLNLSTTPSVTSNVSSIKIRLDLRAGNF